MRATGVVRRIDDLGRIVIPKEIRRTMRMREGDPLEIFTEQNGEIVLKKYSMMRQISSFGQSFADGLSKVSGLACRVCDTDKVVSYAGRGKREILNNPITKEAEEVMTSRTSYFKAFPTEKNIYVCGRCPLCAVGIVPVISAGDCVGAVALLGEPGRTLSDCAKKLLVLTATLLAGSAEG